MVRSWRAKSMSETFRMCSQPTLWNSLDATSLPASEDGTTHCDSPDGPTTCPCGPGAVPASRSRSRGNAAAPTTRAISGRRGFGSSASAALQSSLESRLRARFGTAGSTLFSMIWKAKATPAGRQYCQRVASVRRTSDSDYGSWPTPMAGSPATADYNEAGDTCNGRRTRLLCGSWPTPCQQDGPKGGPGQGQDRLPAAALASWPTTTARDWKSGASNLHGENARPLNEVAMLATLATPVVRDYRNSGGTNRTRDLPGQAACGSSAATGKPGSLNPAFSLWLMGFPTAWARCAARVTRLSRKSRQK